MTVDMKKFEAEMMEHWETDVTRMTHTETFKQVTRNGTDTGWVEMTFRDEDGFEFFAEVNADSEVWNWDMVPERK